MRMVKKYVAFLRGINVGGNSIVSMDQLKESFRNMGFTNVQTVLNSGNVVFAANQRDPVKIAILIENTLQKIFHRPIHTLLRRDTQIQALVQDNPFKKVTMTPAIRCHVTFLAVPHEKRVPFSLESSGNDYGILQVRTEEVCWFVDVGSGKGTADIMGILEKEFGNHITTRTWNTVVKIWRLLG